MTIGEIIRAYRTEHDISQRQFAKLCGLTNGYVSMLESGKNPSTGGRIVPSLLTLTKVAAAMGESNEALLARLEDEDYYEVVFAEQVSVSGSTARLTDDERTLLALFRACADDGRQIILSTARAIEGNPNMRRK